eukprot:jgi/Phyca11/504914/fgenesh2_kg.PHYCAscaffold_10_\
MARGTPRKSVKAAAFVPLLEKLATFKEKQYSLVALEARQLLIDNKMPSYRDRLSQVEKVLKDYLANGSSTNIAEACANLLDQSQPLFDLLISLLDHEDQKIRELALELYAQRVYRSYLIESMETMSFNDIFAKTFQFKSPVVDALAVGVAPAESYDDLASLLRRNSSASSLDLGEHNSEGSSDDQETVDKPLPKPVESYQKISPDFERHGAIVRLT